MQTSLNRRIAADFLRATAMGIIVGAVVSVLLMLLVIGLAGLAQAAPLPAAEQETQTLAEVGSGKLLFKTDAPGRFIAAPTVDTDVAIRVTGLIARARVTQKFVNPGEGWVEGVYVFPLPEGAAVDHLGMQVGSRVIEGQVKERKAAEASYVQARAEGKKASLVTQERPNVFTTSVANIGPHEAVEVTIEYQETVRFDAGRFHLRFPTVVAPRYIPGNTIVGREGTGWALDTDQVPDASRITPPVVKPGQPAVNPLKLKVTLDTGLPMASVASPHHRIETVAQGERTTSVVLADPTVADRDFELVWVPQTGGAPRAALFGQAKDGAEYALLMMLPPQSGQASRLPRESIFIIDTSGSMGGTSITQAREALKLALGKLSAQDTFNIIQFNSVTEALFDGARPVTDETLGQARRFVDRLHATGGTEMAPALKLALTGGEHAARVRQVVFLTDGAVGNEEELFTLIKQRLGNSRLFTVGIGSAPNSHFMTQAAQFGRGTFTFIGNVNEVSAKMGELFAKLDSPVLTDLKVTWPDGTVEAFPAKLPDLYLGEPVVVSARLAQRGGDIVVTGRQGEQPFRSVLQLKGGVEQGGIDVLWARRKIAALTDTLSDGAAPDKVREQVVEVALAHHLVSQYTSLVAVDVTPSRPAGAALGSGALPTNLPAGWSYETTFGSLPQGATAAQWNLLTGALLLALSAAVWAMRRRFGWRERRSIAR